MLQAKLAACRSTCNSRPQGAVLVRDRRVIATGYNGALPGQEHCSDHEQIKCLACGGTGIGDILINGGKHIDCHGTGKIAYCRRRSAGIEDSKKDRACASSHAEANAIAQAARLGIATDGAILYCTTRSCIICTKLLIQAGIAKVFYELDYDSPEENWISHLPMEQLTIRLEIIALARDTLKPNTSKRRLGKTK